MYQGERVHIFQKPLTGEDYEGEAHLQELLKDDAQDGGQQYWKVFFGGDSHAHERWIAVKLEGNQYVPVFGNPSELKSRVIVCVEGGIVQSVMSSNPNLNVDVLDIDNDTIEEDEERLKHNAQLEQECESLHEVY